MKEDELQILGKEQRLGKRKKWHKILFAVVAVVLALGGLWLCSQDKSNVRTTLVPELQAATDYLLNEELEMIDGLQGQVIVMRVETGEILSMVGRERRFDGKFQPCENFGYQQEPGSVMQTAALLAMLETGKVKLEDEVDTGSGVWNIDSISMKDHNWHRGGYGKITLASALKKITKDPRVEVLDSHASMSAMCIANPLGKSGLFAWLAGLWATHPPTEKRIAALLEMDKDVVK